ncbi:MAG: hypothetical protein HY695_37340 [Deltaproteobacteria bacterium]|nr:hypothetical protein [Deltaproteobacteria bacterium]
MRAVIHHLAEREPRYAQRKPIEFIEAGPLSEIDRSGYIERLYASKKY